MDKVKNLYYNGTRVVAQETSFTWKVWQASPGSDILLWISILATTGVMMLTDHFSGSISCLDSDKTQWLAIGMDMDNPQSDNVSHRDNICALRWRSDDVLLRLQ